jgi:hypothetical protein
MATEESVVNFIRLICFCFFVFLSGVLVLFSDATPAVFRKPIAYVGVPLSIVMYLTLCVSILFHFTSTTLQDKTYYIQSILIAASGQCVSCLNTLLIFSIRNIFTAIIYPETMVICKLC